jgi:hypothetical protein
MHNDRHDNIFADDNTLDFIIHGELETQDRELKGGNKTTVLVLLPCCRRHVSCF